ncbi:MAG: YcgN family cysteine cluster protein [Granulosicoccaceae bacterium]|jgi:uncharacterized cysteine cluster protein YcgN (CxxCxxCC family)
MPFWKDKPLAELNQAEWESLCDGCGRCCLHKLEDIESGKVYFTNVACRLLDTDTCQCRDYAHRKQKVPDCIVLTPDTIEDNLSALPHSCAYRLLAAGEGLPDWHPLISGDPQSVITHGISMAGRCVSEVDVAEDELAHHLIELDDS